MANFRSKELMIIFASSRAMSFPRHRRGPPQNTGREYSCVRWMRGVAPRSFTPSPASSVRAPPPSLGFRAYQRCGMYVSGSVNSSGLRPAA